MRRLVAALALIALASCGKELGRIPLTNDGGGTIEIAHVDAGQKLALWTSFDIKFRGGGPQFEAVYTVELFQNDVAVASTVCNPLDVSVKTSSKEVTLTQDKTISYQGKMRCELVAPKAGPAKVKAFVRVNRRPNDLVIGDLGFVVKT